MSETLQEPVSSSRYYSAFRGATFVIQVEAEAVEHIETTRAILQGIRDLMDHGIRVVLVLGMGGQFASLLAADFGACPHPETNRLIIPERALPRIGHERQRLIEIVLGLCQQHGMPGHILPETRVRAERRIGHGSTGVVVAVETPAVRQILQDGGLAILAFGGTDERDHFLYVPSTSLASELRRAAGGAEAAVLDR